MKPERECAVPGWRCTVETFENQEWGIHDEADIENDIAQREVVERHMKDFTPQELEAVKELDERFRKALFPQLRRADKLRFYENAGKVFPELWWWNSKKNGK